MKEFLRKIRHKLYGIFPGVRKVLKISLQLECLLKKSDLLEEKINNLSNIIAVNINQSCLKIQNPIDSVNHLAELHFRNHYNEWRRKRVMAIIKHYGFEWFNGKSILELGCGYGDIGNILYHLGSDVTVSEVRDEHLEKVRKWYPYLKILKHNCEQLLPNFDKKFDLIIHFGVLYHIDNYKEHLADALRYCENMVLETEVSDSDDENFEIYVKENSAQLDHSFTSHSYRPSPAKVEKIIKENNMKFEMVKDDSFNSGMHVYDWVVKNTNTWHDGLRKAWFITAKG